MLSWDILRTWETKPLFLRFSIFSLTACLLSTSLSKAKKVNESNKRNRDQFVLGQLPGYLKLAILDKNAREQTSVHTLEVNKGYCFRMIYPAIREVA